MAGDITLQRIPERRSDACIEKEYSEGIVGAVMVRVAYCSARKSPYLAGVSTPAICRVYRTLRKLQRAGDGP